MLVAVVVSRNLCYYVVSEFHNNYGKGVPHGNSVIQVFKVRDGVE